LEYNLLQIIYYQDKDNRVIQGKMLREKIHNDQLRQISGIQDIIKWANVRRREWDAHVKRMEDTFLTKIARENRPWGVRSRGRPKKCWKEKSQHTSLTLVWKNRRQPIEKIKKMTNDLWI
jgi:type IV secretory pathway VirB4 component